MHTIHTCSTLPERGSMTRSFLSLQLVASRLPSVLKDIQRITSVWQSINFTGSPISRFQMRIYRKRKNTIVKPWVQSFDSFIFPSGTFKFILWTIRIQSLVLTVHTVILNDQILVRCFNFIAHITKFCYKRFHYLVVIASTEENPTSGWVPLYEPHTPAVAVQF